MKRKQVTNEISIIPEIFSGSSTHAVSQQPRQALKSPADGPQVQQLTNCMMARGFTLLELLIVVLIIGVLAAVAVPQYQRAVLKSRFTALMPIGKTLANSNEVYYLEHGEYAGNVTALPVQGQATYPNGTQVELMSDSDFSYTLAYNNNTLPDNNYIVFQKHSTQFPDTTMCEARGTAQQYPLAHEVCTALGGISQEGGVTDNWTAYLLSGDPTGSSFGPVCLSEKPADKIAAVSGATGTAKCVEGGEWVYQWSNPTRNYDGNNSWGQSCYDSSNRAYACSGANFINGAKCSVGAGNYICAGAHFESGASCEFSWSYSSVAGCSNSTFTGANTRCTVNTNGSRRERNTGACAGSTFTNGAFCYSSSTSGGCEGAIIQDGGYCRGRSCDQAIYEGNGCCKEYCTAGSGVPKCTGSEGTANQWDGVTYW